jgi:hypothetical protein
MMMKIFKGLWKHWNAKKDENYELYALKIEDMGDGSCVLAKATFIDII